MHTSKLINVLDMTTESILCMVSMWKLGRALEMLFQSRMDLCIDLILKVRSQFLQSVNQHIPLLIRPLSKPLRKEFQLTLEYAGRLVVDSERLHSVEETPDVGWGGLVDQVCHEVLPLITVPCCEPVNHCPQFLLEDVRCHFFPAWCWGSSCHDPSCSAFNEFQSQLWNKSIG